MASNPLGSDGTVVLTGTSDLSRARRAVADAAKGFLGPERADDVELCVSELLTNAIEHGEGQHAVLEHGVDGDRFVISVSNGARSIPVQHADDVPVEQPAGRGLRLVRLIADGLELHGDRNLVVVSCHFVR